MSGATALGGAVALRWQVAPSRVLFGPHVTNLGHRRALTDRHVAYYARRAAGGAGVIVVETASVHPSDHPYERAPLASDCPQGWTAVARACQPHGALVLAGLGHAGAQGSTGYSRDALWGASGVADPGSREVPREMEQADIDALVAGFAAAAQLAVDAGLDGVEIEAGQHSLLRQFLSGLTNRRADAYGRDRARLLREVIAAVRQALGPEPVLGLRLCCDELAPWAGIVPADVPGLVEGWVTVEGGAAVEGGVAVEGGIAAKGGAAAERGVAAEGGAVAEHGAVAEGGAVDYLVPVRGSALSVGATRPDAHTPPGFNRALCAGLRGVGLPLVLQGSVVDPAQAQAALDAGECVLVEMTRALVADPDLVAHVRAGAPERIRPSTLSNRRFDVRDPRNALVSDDAEPRSGHETLDPPVEPAVAALTPGQLGGSPGPGFDVPASAGGGGAAAASGSGSGPGLDAPAERAGRASAGPSGSSRPTAADRGGSAPAVLVVGGGPAGMEAARTLALRGRQVRLVERSDALGGMLRWAAVLPGRDRLALLVDWWERELARLGVAVETGVEVTAADLDGTGPAVLATGGRPGPRAFPVDGPVLDVAALIRTPLARAGAAGHLPGAQVGGPGRTPQRVPGAAGAALLAGVAEPVAPGPVVVHDPFPDGTGGTVAEFLAARGPTVLVTPDPVAAATSSGDLAPANARLDRAGVERAVFSRLVEVRGGIAVLEHVWTGARRDVPCALVVDCGPRLPDDALARAFPQRPRAGDCVAPRTLHEAVREGRRAAFAVVAAR